MNIKKFIRIGLVILIPFLFLSCGIFNGLYKNNTRIMMVMVANMMRTNNLEKNVACFYKNKDKFPEDNLTLNNFLASLNQNVSDSIFSNLELLRLSNHSIKYNFKLSPFTEPISSSPKNYNFDSIKVTKCVGTLIFDDSLFIENKNKLLVKFKIDSLDATFYENEDSIKYSGEDSHIFQNSASEKLLSIHNSCSK